LGGKGRLASSGGHAHRSLAETGADMAKTNVNGGGMANATIIERLG
jgi:hypothetical protein